MLGKDFLQTAARLGSDARDMMGSMAGEVERLVKARIDARLKSLNLVSREEFEALKTLAEQARAKVEKLEKQLEERQSKPASSASEKKPKA